MLSPETKCGHCGMDVYAEGTLDPKGASSCSLSLSLALANTVCMFIACLLLRCFITASTTPARTHACTDYPSFPSLLPLFPLSFTVPPLS